MTYETLTFDVQDNVGILTLNRPDNANALTGLMAKEMFDVSIRCENDPEVRAVLFTGAGKMFCAGGDLKEFEAEGDNLCAMITETAALVHSAVIRHRTFVSQLGDLRTAARTIELVCFF